MARQFDELESEVRRRARRDEEGYLSYLQEMLSLREPPPPTGLRIRDIKREPPPDTFDQRFHGAPLYPSEQPYRVRPGYRERFLDPTKVISEAPSEQPYRVAQAGGGAPPPPSGFTLPEGFTLEPQQQKSAPEKGASTSAGFDLPEGFSLAPEGAAPTAGYGSIPEDPFERAALRVQRRDLPAQGRQEGGATKAIESFLPAVNETAGQMFNLIKGAREEGDLPPKQAMELAAMMTPASMAYRTGIGVAQAARPRGTFASRNTPDPTFRPQQLETGVMSIPQAAIGGPTEQLAGRGLSSLPFVGSGLRQSAERATQELQAAGSAAAARPTGTAVDQSVAGGAVRQGLQDSLTAGEAVPAKLRGLLRKSNEDVIGDMIRMAGSKGGADIGTLAQLRRHVPVESHGEVQSALIGRLGRSPTTAEFDPKTWIRNYGNLSDRGKTVLFGREGGSLRYHLDSIEAVSRRAPSWKQFQRERSALGTGVGVVGLAGTVAGTYYDPLTTLGTMVPLGIIARGLSRPATAAPIAQWARAYERVARTKGAPQAIAAFTISTRNLNNSLGTDVNAEAVLRGQPEGGI